MSGKKDKESRRVLNKINKVVRNAQLEVEEERNRLAPLVIRKYHEKINELPLRKRTVIIWRIIWSELS